MRKSVNAVGGSVKLEETRHAIHPFCGPVAQLVEHVTFNHRVAGSSPARLTTPTISKKTTYNKARLHGLNMYPSFGTMGENADDLQASPQQWIRPEKGQAVPPSLEG